MATGDCVLLPPSRLLSHPDAEYAQLHAAGDWGSQLAWPVGLESPGSNPPSPWLRSGLSTSRCAFSVVLSTLALLAEPGPLDEGAVKDCFALYPPILRARTLAARLEGLDESSARLMFSRPSGESLRSADRSKKKQIMRIPSHQRQPARWPLLASNQGSMYLCKIHFIL